MGNFIVKSGVIALMLGLIAVGCDKKSTEATTGNEPPTIPVLQFSSPATPDPSDTSQCHWTAYLYSQLSNAFAMYPTIINGLQPTSSGNTWTWTYPSDSVTATITATLANNVYSWKMVLNGVSDGVPISNWTAMEGTTNLDGSEGSFSLYEEYTTALMVNFSYTKTAAGVLTGTTIYYDQGTPVYKTVHVSNPDGSGEIIYYEYSNQTYVQMFHATWTNGAPAVCG
jgi:hypothetical protein